MRSDRQRLEDVLAATDAIASHLARGTSDDDLVFDAIRVRLIEIGEAIKDIDVELLAREADVPWQDIARMRDHLTHRYFDTAHSVVAATVENDLPPLAAAVRRLLDGFADGDELP